jgi:hypothetical protein
MKREVTQATYCRAESDRAFSEATRMAGCVNRLYSFRRLAPLDRQTVVRMNRDTLYSVGVVDTSAGAAIVVPPMPAGRYASVMLVDNDHYCPGVLYASGRHELPRDTKYIGVIVRIQLLRPDDPDDVALVNALQDGFTIEAGSADPFPEPTWDLASLDALRATYNAEFARFDAYPDGWMGRRGEADERTRHVGCAGAWGLFPNSEAVYINYNGRLPAEPCHCATYHVPEHDAFWSITVYGADGFMKSDRCILNAANATMNADGTFTVRFGSEQACGDAPNRLDAPDGWNFLMRVYRPGRTVLEGRYTLPDPVRCGRSGG